MADSYRLTFEEQEDQLSLLSVERLAMRAPPGQLREKFSQELTGRFAELRDEQGNVLYRRSINGLLQPTIEYPTGDTLQPFARVKASNKRIVSILVPALSGGKTVSLIETAPRELDEPRTEPRKQTVLISVQLPDRGDETRSEENG